MDTILITVDIYGIIYELEQKIYYKKEKLIYLSKKKEIAKTKRSIRHLESKLSTYYQYVDNIPQLNLLI